MKVHEQDGKVEIGMGRWTITVSKDEAHAVRCAIAGPLSRFLPPNAVAKKPGLAQLIADTATEYDHVLAQAGVIRQSIWLEVGELRIVLRAVQALRLWKHLDALNRPCHAGKSSQSVNSDLEDLLDEDWKREMGL